VKHGWNSLEDYLYQYHRRLEDYPGFIEDYTFSADPVFENERAIVSINMEIFCINKTRITVVKTAQVKFQENKFLAKTEDYSYNASIMGKGNIFRYDNAHVHSGHKTKHHKHIFSIPGMEDRNSPITIEDDKWPHLHQVVEELMQY
jgi:hypothetical protein